MSLKEGLTAEERACSVACRLARTWKLNMGFEGNAATEIAGAIRAAEAAARRETFREAGRTASVRAAKQRAEAERHYQPEPGGGCDADMYDADAMGATALAKAFYARAEEER